MAYPVHAKPTADDPLVTTAPQEAAVLSSAPVEIRIALHASAQLSTFSAKLNDKDISPLFTQVPGGLSATVSANDGLNISVVGSGKDGLGMVYEAHGQNREDADCYRRVVDFMRAHRGDFGPELEADAVKRIGELEPPAATV